MAVERRSRCEGALENECGLKRHGRCSEVGWLFQGDVEHTDGHFPMVLLALLLRQAGKIVGCTSHILNRSAVTEGKGGRQQRGIGQLFQRTLLNKRVRAKS